MSDERPVLLTVTEAAEFLRVPKSWIYERSRRNALPGQCRVGRHVRINIEELEDGLRDGVVA